MRQTLVLHKAVVATSFFFLGALAFAAGADTSRETREAQTLLKRIQSAAHQLNYAGTFVYQQGSQMRTSRITHLVDGRNEVEKLEVLDGKPREYIRTNDEVVCYLPETRTLLVEKREGNDVFPAILGGNLADIGEHYSVRLDSASRVAGHDCQAVILEPKDAMRYGYRLCGDKSTGLLLRAQTLSEKQEVIEQIAFTQISIGNVERARAKPSFGNTAGWRVENAVMAQGAPSGWSVRSLPAGFRKVREVKRLVSDAGASGASGGQNPGREVAQLVFSDGLAAISVFIEPGSQSRTEGSIQQGALNIIGKRQGDFWLTIVGEVPAAALRQVASSIEFKSKHPE